MKPGIVRIFGRYLGMPEVCVAEVPVTKHPQVRLSRLQAAFGDRWELSFMQIPKENPVIRQRLEHLRPKRSRIQLYATEGFTSEANKQPFNPKGPAAYAGVSAT